MAVIKNISNSIYKNFSIKLIIEKLCCCEDSYVQGSAEKFFAQSDRRWDSYIPYPHLTFNPQLYWLYGSTMPLPQPNALELNYTSSTSSIMH